MPGLTQLEIARLARVSQATVSRVLNNDPRVNEAARKRVLEVIRAHNYVPNARAQSLRSQHSGVIGLVVHRKPEELEQDPFFCPLIVSILRVSAERGYHLCVDTDRNVRSRRPIHEELLRSHRVDGLILVESRDYDERIERLVAEEAPFVLIGRYGRTENLLSVDNDNRAAGRMVTEKLISDGHRRIAYIGGPKGVNVSEDRLTGYLEALQANAVPFQAVEYGNFTAEGGRQAMKRLLSLPTPPDAVVAVDDVTAAAAMQVALENGLHVPEDIAFVGFNNSSFCSYLEPPLTSVSINISSLARTATEMLIDLIEGHAGRPQHCIVPCHIVLRGSTRQSVPTLKDFNRHVTQ
ncbi:LacI family DNA-binding transcriptional regulator [Chthonomonas calidirosea]|uniref:LacI family DNA-binding transcriptional regulator n=1 Tax=Chthonomonas calidirosea TaxID=454171 RepID=UPI0006EC9BFA|nr:LacI family DNA-binding transcriptional regulator [Chthonomonas calidirosea]CEK18046.1 transcriptional regulator, LacI family [Chthonomonas calidirosea]